LYKGTIKYRIYSVMNELGPHIGNSLHSHAEVQHNLSRVHLCQEKLILVVGEKATGKEATRKTNT
jgi:hypothetical protein